MERYKTLGQSTLTAGINSSVTTVPVTSAAALRDSFNADDTYRIKVDNEIMAVTAEATNTLTVTRGTEGTTAATHANGATVTQIMTAAAMNQIKHDALGGGSEVLHGTSGALVIGVRNRVTAATALTMTLPAVTTGGSTVSIIIDANSVAAVTLDPSGSTTIDGQLTRIMFAGETVILIENSASNQWEKISGKTIPARCKIRLTTTQSLPDTTPTFIQYNGMELDNTGLMATLGSNAITIRRPGNYMARCGMTASGIATAPCTRWLVTLFVNAAAIDLDDVPGGAVGALCSAKAMVLANLAAGDILKAEGFQISGNAQGLKFGPTPDHSCSMEVAEVPLW